MANSEQALKRIRQNEKTRARKNQSQPLYSNHLSQPQNHAGLTIGHNHVLE